MAQQQHVSVLRRTVAKAWDDRVLGLSAEAAFWQLLSLAPLFLALLGSIGYLSGLLGADHGEPGRDVAAGRVPPGLRAERGGPDHRARPWTGCCGAGGPTSSASASCSRLWAGSSATATFVNTVTIAYGMRDLRGAVRSRLLALGLYLLTVVIGIVLLPVMVLGPGRLVSFFPDAAQGDVETIVQATYWPLVAVLLLVGLVTFYHLAPPRRLPWRRGFPGAVLAALVFVGGTLGLRTYIDFIVDHGFSYGALAAPIGALLFFYVLALAVLLGAELNATIEQTWPSRKQPPGADERPDARLRTGRRGPACADGGPQRSGSPSSPGGRLSQISLHSGQTGYFFGSRDGVQTLPHSARTGVPLTSASMSLSFGTKCENRSESPGSGRRSRSGRVSMRSSTAVPGPGVCGVVIPRWCHSGGGPGSVRRTVDFLRSAGH